MSEILNSAVRSVCQSKASWCRFITGNDTGTTGSHQAGFYIPKCASELLFDEPGQKGENKERLVQIKWQDDFVTQSCMKYYGQGTRNEYRITRFGRSFPFLQDDNVGDLLIIAKYTEEDYKGFVLSSDEDIDDFFATFNNSLDWQGGEGRAANARNWQTAWWKFSRKRNKKLNSITKNRDFSPPNIPTFS